MQSRGTPARRAVMSCMLVLAPLLVQLPRAGVAQAQTSSQEGSVLLHATVEANPAAIRLHFEPHPNTSGYSIFRRDPSESTWGGSIGTAVATAVDFVDTSIVAGLGYEYKVVRQGAGGTGYGYIMSGISLPPVGSRGTILLVVDDMLVTPLALELEQLAADLVADGWAVARHEVSAGADVAAVKAAIVAAHSAASGDLKALYLIGHVPVPYSGNLAPDGHAEHSGAWPADGYYGDIDGDWTDTSTVNSGVGYPWNTNVVGDGRFDHNRFPSRVELQVGRVDLSRLPAFADDYVELTRSYLTRAHGYKVKQWEPQPRGIMFDNLSWVANPLAGAGYMTLAANVGVSNMTFANENGAPFASYMNGESYLWTYHSGGGLQGQGGGGGVTFNGTSNGLTTEELAAMDYGGVFNLSLGSYFGDWDNSDNFLRAMIAGGDALTNAWGGLPNWYCHQTAMGEPVGQCARRSMNNDNANYTPQNGGWQGQQLANVHLALMGDPSLRTAMIAPPSALAAEIFATGATFSWTESPDAVDGYLVYAVDPVTGVQTPLLASPVTGNSLSTSTGDLAVGNTYSVRAVTLQVSKSGSYFNQSLGALAVGQDGGTGPTGATVGSGGAGGDGSGGAGASGGMSSGAGGGDDVDGCGCRVTGRTPMKPSGDERWAFAVTLLGAALRRKRGRRGR